MTKQWKQYNTLQYNTSNSSLYKNKNAKWDIIATNEWAHMRHDETCKMPDKKQELLYSTCLETEIVTVPMKAHQMLDDKWTVQQEQTLFKRSAAKTQIHLKFHNRFWPFFC